MFGLGTIMNGKQIMTGEGASEPGSQQCIQQPDDTPGQYAAFK
jgi:hypothetical protein